MEEVVSDDSALPSRILSLEWVAYLTDAGDEYYYNLYTQEVTWDEPLIDACDSAVAIDDSAAVTDDTNHNTVQELEKPAETVAEPVTEVHVAETAQCVDSATPAEAEPAATVQAGDAPAVANPPTTSVPEAATQTVAEKIKPTKPPKKRASFANEVPGSAAAGASTVATASAAPSVEAKTTSTAEPNTSTVAPKSNIRGDKSPDVASKRSAVSDTTTQPVITAATSVESKQQQKQAAPKETEKAQQASSTSRLSSMFRGFGFMSSSSTASTTSASTATTAAAKEGQPVESVTNTTSSWASTKAGTTNEKTKKSTEKATSKGSEGTKSPKSDNKATSSSSAVEIAETVGAAPNEEAKESKSSKEKTTSRTRDATKSPKRGSAGSESSAASNVTGSGAAESPEESKSSKESKRSKVKTSTSSTQPKAGTASGDKKDSSSPAAGSATGSPRSPQVIHADVADQYDAEGLLMLNPCDFEGHNSDTDVAEKPAVLAPTAMVDAPTESAVGATSKSKAVKTGKSTKATASAATATVDAPAAAAGAAAAKKTRRAAPSPPGASASQHDTADAERPHSTTPAAATPEAAPTAGDVPVAEEPHTAPEQQKEHRRPPLLSQVSSRLSATKPPPPPPSLHRSPSSRAGATFAAQLQGSSGPGSGEAATAPTSKGENGTHEVDAVAAVAHEATPKSVDVVIDNDKPKIVPPPPPPPPPPLPIAPEAAVHSEPAADAEELERDDSKPASVEDSSAPSTADQTHDALSKDAPGPMPVEQHDEVEPDVRLSTVGPLPMERPVSEVPSVHESVLPMSVHEGDGQLDSAAHEAHSAAPVPVTDVVTKAENVPGEASQASKFVPPPPPPPATETPAPALADTAVESAPTTTTPVPEPAPTTKVKPAKPPKKVPPKTVVLDGEKVPVPPPSGVAESGDAESATKDALDAPKEVNSAPVPPPPEEPATDKPGALPVETVTASNGAVDTSAVPTVTEVIDAIEAALTPKHSSRSLPPLPHSASVKEPQAEPTAEDSTTTAPLVRPALEHQDSFVDESKAVTPRPLAVKLKNAPLSFREGDLADFELRHTQGPLAEVVVVNEIVEPVQEQVPEVPCEPEVAEDMPAVEAATEQIGDAGWTLPRAGPSLRTPPPAGAGFIKQAAIESVFEGDYDEEAELVTTHKDATICEERSDLVAAGENEQVLTSTEDESSTSAVPPPRPPPPPSLPPVTSDDAEIESSDVDAASAGEHEPPSEAYAPALLPDARPPLHISTSVKEPASDHADKNKERQPTSPQNVPPPPPISPPPPMPPSDLPEGAKAYSFAPIPPPLPSGPPPSAPPAEDDAPTYEKGPQIESSSPAHKSTTVSPANPFADEDHNSDGEADDDDGNPFGGPDVSDAHVSVAVAVSPGSAHLVTTAATAKASFAPVPTATVATKGPGRTIGAWGNASSTDGAVSAPPAPPAGRTMGAWGNPSPSAPVGSFSTKSGASATASPAPAAGRTMGAWNSAGGSSGNLSGQNPNSGASAPAGAPAGRAPVRRTIGGGWSETVAGAAAVSGTKDDSGVSNNTDRSPSASPTPALNAAGKPISPLLAIALSKKHEASVARERSPMMQRTSVLTSAFPTEYPPSHADDAHSPTHQRSRSGDVPSAREDMPLAHQQRMGATLTRKRNPRPSEVFAELGEMEQIESIALKKLMRVGVKYQPGFDALQRCVKDSAGVNHYYNALLAVHQIIVAGLSVDPYGTTMWEQRISTRIKSWLPNCLDNETKDYHTGYIMAVTYQRLQGNGVQTWQLTLRYSVFRNLNAKISKYVPSASLDPRAAFPSKVTTLFSGITDKVRNDRMNQLDLWMRGVLSSALLMTIPEVVEAIMEVLEIEARVSE